MCKDKLLKSKVSPLEYYYSYIPRTKLLFFYQYIPMSGLSQCKTGLLSQYICWCFSRRYHDLCQVLLIHNVFMMVGFFSHSICESSGAHCMCLTSFANYLHTQILDQSQQQVFHNKQVCKSTCDYLYYHCVILPCAQPGSSLFT